MAFTHVVLASGSLKIQILPLNAEKAVVAVSGPAENAFHISIENQTGKVLYQYTTSGLDSDYSKLYDFSGLEAGEYLLKVSIDGETMARDFTLGNELIKVGKIKPVIKPFFSVKEGVLKITYMNFGQTDAQIGLYKDSDLIFTKSYNEHFNISDALNLSKLEPGEYEVCLSAGIKKYFYQFDIE